MTAEREKTLLAVKAKIEEALNGREAQRSDPFANGLCEAIWIIEGMLESDEQSAEPANPYRFVGLSSAYAAVRMPDGTMSEGRGDTVAHAITNAHQRWQEQP